MRCGRCGYAVPEWLWLDDDHPILIEQKPTTITRDDSFGIDRNVIKITAESFIEIKMCLDVNQTSTNSDFIDIGPECFADRQALVISYKGENYYKACGKFIHQLQNGTRTHCVKRVGHFNDCEDYDGTTRNHLHPSDSGIPRSSR